MSRVMLTGLVKVELPGHTARLCDGGFLPVDGETFRASDTLLGTIGGLDALSEGVGDEVPGFSITFLPPDASSAATLNNGNNQGARVRVWIAEVDEDTGLIVGEPDQQADAMIDMSRLQIGAESRAVEVDCVPSSERLFSIDEGNTLSDAFHQGVFPGELGFANVTAVSTVFAWGATAASRGSTSLGGGYSPAYGGGSGGGGSFQEQQNAL